ncbi:hypothetical protein [Cardinium endosymbiont of Tipula unca]|uniref:hypothetical protein n=1 Tax=Cardinium endosymbiont of Tipula unca TaxID=3066216 RepID=UPI0030D0C4DA
MSIKKHILSLFFIVFYFVAHPSKAIGIATGPSLGVAGYYASFDSITPGKTNVTISNRAIQLGGFAKLDLALFYARLDALIGLNWHHLPHHVDSKCLKHLTVPVTIGVSLFDTIRPHLGIVFHASFSDDEQSNQITLIETYKKKIQGYLFGVGLDLGNFLIDLDFQAAFSTLPRKSIDPLLVDGDKDYTPKQFVLKVGYNLLGLLN